MAKQQMYVPHAQGVWSSTSRLAKYWHRRQMVGHWFNISKSALVLCFRDRPHLLYTCSSVL